MVASSAASAQAFDAGGRSDMTQGDATDMLEKHGHESDAAEIIDKCALAWNASGCCHAVFFRASLCCVSVAFQSGGLRAGDLVDACNDLKCLL